MCRLFGFRSVIPSQVHRSLLAAENALGKQSNQHPDGWGVAFYVDGSPHVTKSAELALGDQLFHRLSGVVASETVLAHVRRATQGEKSVLNCHPFQYGRWVFAHNGDIPGFERHRAALTAEIQPKLRRFVLGDTDSELVFLIFLSFLSANGPLGRRHTVDDVSSALRAAIQRVRAICDEGTAERALLTLMVTDGDTMVATHGGKELYWSSYKTRCADRDACPSLSAECEAPSRTGFVNHFILSSEPLSGENVWEALSDGDVIGVDWRMRVLKTHIDRVALPIAAAQ
ncbi:MAG: class II glutamine amidotransferase [Polyangiaceae bacterium]|nr:class II glutamine amidotransferase [Polyangiaceae bacterium]MBK8996052.1 class II glutamine amidotransferase [Myxococcales bacterium]MCE7890145.1 class II glutamine amidotransferase [Sorangiineae bacterium PRO1]MCL4751704.1 class II glutamine amidotransferase [Myxococcales bacterium]